MKPIVHLDRQSSGGASVMGWTGKVEFRGDLPVTLGTPSIGAIYLVEKPTKILFGAYTTYQSGLYIKEADTGSLSDWRRLNIKVNFTDGEFAFVNAADQSKRAQFDLSLLTTSTTYTYRFPAINNGIFIVQDTPYVDYLTGAANPAHKEGRSFWNDVKKCLSIYEQITGTTLDVGEEFRSPLVKNISGVTIPNGKLVSMYADPVDGWVIQLAVANDPSKISQLFWTTHDIPNGTLGRTVKAGELGDTDTTGVAENSQLYLHPTIPGKFTDVKPNDEEFFVIPVGKAKDSQVSGNVYAEITGTINNPYMVIFSDNFESGDFTGGGWTVVGSTNTNNTFEVGTAEKSTGTYGAYVSIDGGVTAGYESTGPPVLAVNHIYVDIAIPANAIGIRITFPWKCVAEPGFDYGNVFLAPTSVTPTTDVQVSSTYMVGAAEYNNNSVFLPEKIDIDATGKAGTTQRLIFSFRCDTSVAINPGFCLDNIELLTR